MNVVDDQTGQPIPDAFVTVDPRRLEWSYSTFREADAQGDCTVAPLPPGEMAVAVQADGYEKWENIDIILPHEEVIRVELKRADVDRDESP